ncbi:MAG: hypothetical protein II299_00480 [Alistipes sp.]|nr:hypothetical protein [Alistipes sp.]
MKGIRKRVTIGFLSIVVLLFFSGLVSLFELNHMSTDIEAILSSNKRSIELAENMLDAISAHDRAVVNYAVFRDTLYSDSCKMRFVEFSDHIDLVRKEASKSTVMMFDSLRLNADRLQAVVHELRTSRTIENLVLLDTLYNGATTFDGKGWYERNYVPAYDDTSNSIMRVMSHAQISLSPRAEQLSRNAYRAVTPVFISLVVMIVILLMFYYFIMIYALKPIIEMNQSLGNWLRYKVPFKTKSECRDELLELKEKIESVITTPKNIIH